MAKRILLARHARAEENIPPRYFGLTDIPLSPEGMKQAKIFQTLLKPPYPQKCFASPLRRARETAELLAKPFELEVSFDPDLREVDFGDWDGKTFQEIVKTDPEAVDRWAKNDPSFAFPGGEKILDFQARIGASVDRLVNDEAEVVLAVAHGGPIRFAICRLLGLPAAYSLLFDIKPASLTTIDLYEKKGVLVELTAVQEG